MYNSRKKTFAFKLISLIMIAFIAVITCDNQPIYLYIGYITMMGITILNMAFNKKINKIKIRAPMLLLVVFGCFCALSGAWAWDPALVQSNQVVILAGVSMIVIMGNYFIEENSPEIILLTILLSGLVLSFYVVISYGGLSAFYDIASKGEDRLGSEIKNVNSIGMSCAYSSVILCYYAIYKKQRLCWIIMILPTIVLLSTASRKAILMLLLGCFLLVILRPGQERGYGKYLKIIIGLIILICIVYAVLQLPLLSNVSERLEMAFSTLTGDVRHADGSSITRKRMIEVGLEQFTKTPFIGIGLNNSSILNFNQLRFAAYSHNDYVDLLVNGGAIGFGLYYGTIFILLRRHIVKIKHNIDDVCKISFVLMIMLLFANMAAVTYYGGLTTYVLILLWVVVAYA